ncbi:hypothetical protein KGF54_003831 [Candida jiufengensis]|uniref:uncharacterized protein n=1 Tax=Candida jiufengensis TaxID=497108 RepID=UPI002225542A|nr:uncharacterized protein KGF54_003831 [Candida jiufengensis]KAI5950757.1 hypothetical protein KGF54_003831 [Candida jiufengensis]
MTTNVVISNTTDLFSNNNQDYLPKRSNSRHSSNSSSSNYNNINNNYTSNTENSSLNNNIPRVVNDNMQQQYQQQQQYQYQQQQYQQYQQQQQQQQSAPTSSSSSTTISTMAGSNSSTNLSKRVHREVRFGSYILGSTLGEGEFGKVKLGWRKDGKIPSQVAIKLIKRSTIVKDSDSEIKIHREINSLKLLNHPNIVNLVEVMKSGKYVGIVLEYASGGELFDYILQHKYLKESIAKKLFAQLVSGVDYMHSKGLIHRDLKLENLLLDKHKNVIISDFGFVNSYNKDRNDLMKTSCGSPCYAAPELVLTQTPYEGRKVDIWSLGVILFAMLSGYLPFDDDPENEDGSDIIKLYHYICKTPLTFPEFVSPLARDLLRKIIVSDPKKRINIEEIRTHSFLSSYSQLLSIRQPDWDRIYKEKQKPIVVEPQAPTYNKRYSMVNIPTYSSSLVGSSMQHQYSQINQIHQPQSQSQPQSQPQSQQSQPISSHSRSYSSTSISLLYASPSMSNGTNSHHPSDSTDTLALSKTPSPKKPSSVSPTRGHQKSASISNSTSSASFALKAVVHDDILSSRPTILASNNNYTSASTISTIVESPTKPQHSFDQQQGRTTPILLPPKEFAKLPHATKKPRPTSYHPSSMSSIMPTYKEIIKLPNNSNNSTNSVTQYISTSPPKEIFNAERSQQSSRRNSVVTHLNVNGVLTKEHHQIINDSPDNKRNSVLSYLEDKIEALDLTDSHSHSPTKEQSPLSAVEPVTSKDNEEPVKEENDVETEKVEVDTKLVEIENETDNKDKEVEQKQETPVEELPAPVEEYIEKLASQTSDILDTPAPATEPKDKSPKPTMIIPKPTTKVSRRHSIISRRSISTNKSDENKENKEIISKEAKKKNRFSLLSFYSTYNNNSSNVSLSSSTNKDILTSNTNIQGSSKPRKALGPSNESNIPKQSTTSSKQQRVNSSNSSTSTKRQSILEVPQSNNSNGGANRNNETKESSTAKKVMDFFKRRSIYNVV